MGHLIVELCKSPYFHALMYVVIFTVLGYLFRSKVGKHICGVYEMQVNKEIKEVKDQNDNMKKVLDEHTKLLAQIGQDVKWIKNNGR